MLFVRKEYFEAIRSGAKTTTLRFWRWPTVRPGSVHTVRGLGRVRIHSVEPLQPEDLTDDHARRDGFEDLAELHAALERHYPADKRNSRKLFLVRFEFIQDDHPQKGQA